MALVMSDPIRICPMLTPLFSSFDASEQPYLQDTTILEA